MSTGPKSQLVSSHLINKYPNTFNKEVCKRIFNGAQIVHLKSLNKPTVKVVHTVTEIIKENPTEVFVLIISTVFSFVLLMINMGLLAHRI